MSTIEGDVLKGWLQFSTRTMRLFRRSLLCYRLLTYLLLVQDGWCFLVGRTKPYGGHKKTGPWQRTRARNHNINRLQEVNKMPVFKDKRISATQKQASGDRSQAGNDLYLFMTKVEECAMDYGLRMDCGYFGIKQEECDQRECCWGETTISDVPWCYHSKSTIKSACLLEKLERQECGWYGIKKGQCLAMNCCWQPSNDNNIPWCFQPLHKPSFEGECGISARLPSTSSRIVGGTEAKPYSWPWMVSLQLDDVHFCGGALLNNQWVVSAAHCEPGFLYGSKRSIVLSVHDVKADERINVKREIDRLLPHDNFGESGLEGDIMLIKLKQPVQFSDTVTPICLPESGQEVNPGKHCYTTGWGVLTRGGEYPDKLQQVMVPIINSSVCGNEDWYGDRIHQTMLCAGYEEGGRDSCQGDSGGPLVCNVDGIWTLFGIVSWGEGCASERKPGVYSKVSYYVNWMEATMNDNS